MSIGQYLKLPTLAEVQAERRDFSKGATPTRLQAKDAKDKDDEKKLAQWRREIFDRDEGKCRCCGVKVVRLAVRTLHPRRAECHHVAGRDDTATRYDPRAGLLVCASCHERLTGKVNDKLRIVGTAFFRVQGTKYIDCYFPVDFKKVV